MARKEAVATIRLTEPYRIFVKYAPRVIVPWHAIDERWRRISPSNPQDWGLWLGATFITNDQRYVKMRMVATYDNRDGAYDGELDMFSLECYGMPFLSIKPVWTSRFPNMDGFWVLIELKEYANRNADNNEQRGSV